MQVFTIVKNVTGEGKDLQTEYQVAGNVNLVQAQQMLTEATITLTKAEAKAEVAKQAEAKVEEGKPKES